MRRPLSPARKKFPWKLAVLAALPIGLMGAGSNASASGASFTWQPFGFLTESRYGSLEKGGLVVALLIAIAGLVYAFRMRKQVLAAETGTPAMQEIAAAVREGANAYLRRQFSVVGVLIVVISALIVIAKWPWLLDDAHHTKNELTVVAIGRGVAFLMGSLFSASVGFTGMRLATAGNLRVAAAARNSFGDAMRIAYRTGTVTGMFTCGLGLLGGTAILLVFGEVAYETLLGFGFGGSLLALFMRVGGGIYTKAADVGADLVGKVEQSMAEDDPRNAATIADNVGDNVGDCAGMAADVFESYAVTMVASVILGYASIGYKGMIFPLLVMAVGVVSSMISTALVGKGMTTGTSASAMKSINNGFWRSAAISIIGFMVLGLVYLRFDAPYIVTVAIDRGMYKEDEFQKLLGRAPFDLAKEAEMKSLRRSEGVTSKRAEEIEREIEIYRKDTLSAWQKLTADEQAKMSSTAIEFRAVPKAQRDRLAGFGLNSDGDAAGILPVGQLASARYVPLKEGLDLSAAWCCLIGILLAVALNRCTEYWTSTEYNPVKEVVKASRTGHATNIISGLALGYESSVWAVLIISSALLGSVMVFQDTNNLLFIAFGVAMTGIGMLTLTGDTISMDVFGPVADNANGIGEMGYNKAHGGADLKPTDPDYLTPEQNKTARQILADLDAVGNTTKAITKGVAIGSAVIAAVSLFASFIAVLVTGSEEKIGQLTIGDFVEGAAKLTVADPYVFIGMLIGGAVPMLFSAMTIRAVGRAAYLIVFECRNQFRDPDIMAGRRRPDYGRVVDICTGTAQKELIGPGLLAICTPLCVGFLLGPFALGGFLAGMILSGQLLAVFMSNAGGAWDNAKKMIEDDPKTATTGKHSEMHKASVTGDTVGDPLKDTAGPAINPLIKVMNMVSLLALPLVIMHNLKDGAGDRTIGGVVLAISALAVAWAWWQSKRETAATKQMEEAMSEGTK
ncbi:MAG TPA: sodium/proton-translocating pyrophosphatase [Fimbriiglobus sp.]|jgi:K(+)-stimulated pyrophosphate-energized sodium pump